MKTTTTTTTTPAELRQAFILAVDLGFNPDLIGKRVPTRSAVQDHLTARLANLDARPHLISETDWHRIFAVFHHAASASHVLVTGHAPGRIISPGHSPDSRSPAPMLPADSDPAPRIPEYIRDPEALAALVRSDRLAPVHVRLSTGLRFTTPAQNVSALIDYADRAGDHVRDLERLRRIYLTT